MSEGSWEDAPHQLPSAKLLPLPISNNPWSHQVCILVIVDQFSKSCRLIPLKHLPTAMETSLWPFLPLLWSSWRFGRFSDRGPRSGKSFSRFIDPLEIKMVNPVSFELKLPAYYRIHPVFHYARDLGHPTPRWSFGISCWFGGVWSRRMFLGP